MKRASFEHMPCPAAQAMELIGDGWNLLILREAFYGASRFDQFAAHLGIASNTLSNRLKTLVDNGLFERRLYSTRPARHEYLLTAKGRDLRPVILTLMQWGRRHGAQAGRRVQLIDTRNGAPVEIALVDARSGEPIGPHHQIRRAAEGVALPATA